MKTCFICSKVYSKGITVCCSRQCHNKRINSSNFRDYSRMNHVLKKHEKINEYNLNPLKCSNKECSNTLTFHQASSSYKFCSHSCSATVNNSRNIKSTVTREKISKSVIQNNLIKLKKNYCKVYFINCIRCHTLFSSRIKSTTHCSNSCKSKTNIVSYRQSCKFKISKSTNPELFNIELLKNHGWYRAANHKLGYNPDGATWDHLFRIEDSFRLGVDPAIMSHPANAEMISWRDNIRRRKSQISYSELIERIENYDKID